MPVRREKVAMSPSTKPWGLDAEIHKWQQWMTATGHYVGECVASESNDEIEPTHETQIVEPDWSRWTPPTDGIAWLQENIDTIAGVTKRGFYEDEQAARSAVITAEKAGTIKCVGTVPTKKKGRRPNAYCGYPSNAIKHDLRGTEFRWAYADVYCERYGRLLYGCDMILHFSGEKRACIEIDNNTMTLNTKQRDRWRQYHDAHDVVLVVTKSRQRMKNLQAMSEAIAEIALFAVLDEVLQASWEECYETIEGHPMSLKIMLD